MESNNTIDVPIPTAVTAVKKTTPRTVTKAGSEVATVMVNGSPQRVLLLKDFTMMALGVGAAIIGSLLISIYGEIRNAKFQEFMKDAIVSQKTEMDSLNDRVTLLESKTAHVPLMLPPQPQPQSILKRSGVKGSKKTVRIEEPDIHATTSMEIGKDTKIEDVTCTQPETCAVNKDTCCEMAIADPTPREVDHSRDIQAGFIPATVMVIAGSRSTQSDPRIVPVDDATI
jgi:hypothetical protein